MAPVKTQSQKYLMVMDSYANLTQWNIKTFELIKEYKQVLDRVGATAETKNSRYFFAIDKTRGILKQWDLESRVLIKDYGQAHRGYCDVLHITSCDQYILSTGGGGGSGEEFIKIWNIGEQRLIRTISKLSNSDRNCTALTTSKDLRYLF